MSFTISASNGANWGHRAANMVDCYWSIQEFYDSSNITFTYNQKYRINRLTLGSYCYRPESKRAIIYV